MFSRVLLRTLGNNYLIAFPIRFHSLFHVCIAWEFCRRSALNMNTSNIMALYFIIAGTGAALVEKGGLVRFNKP